MDLSSYDFEYLRPPFEASFINHNLDYIKSESGKKNQRRIFYNVSFETFELKAIQDLEDLLKSQGVTLPIEWNSSETLKFLYAEKFNLDSAAEMIKACLEWRLDPRTSIIDETVFQYFEAGVIYLWGLDAQYRPILIINLNKLRQVQIDEDTFKISLVIMFDILRTYCFLPRKIENWIVIIDAQGVKTIDPENIKSIMYLTRCCFPSTLERLFVITAPIFKTSHLNLIQSMTDDKSDLEDVHLISTNELSELQRYIPADSLEKKYGGECPNIETFWLPPRRNELNNQRGSNTSLKQISEVPSLKDNISTKRGNYDTTFGEFGKPYTFAEGLDPRSIESSRIDQTKYQPSPGLSTYSNGNPRKSPGLFNRTSESGDNLAESTYVNRSFARSGETRDISDPNSGLKSYKSSPGKNRANDPFQARRSESVKNAQSEYNRRSYDPALDNFNTQVVEMPKNKPKGLWEGKMESLGYQGQFSNPSIDSRGEMNHQRTNSLSRRKETGENGSSSREGKNHPYAGLGYQRENMKNLEGSPSRKMYGMYGTYEENEENMSTASLSKKEKEKIKKKLIEVTRVRDQESDEEDEKSKKGLFCGCCVDNKKKRQSSKMKRSKYV